MRAGLFALILLFGLTWVSTAPGVADPWGTNTDDTGAHPDSNPHTYCFQDPGGYRADVNDITDNALATPTDANISFHSWCDFSSQSETDVVWRQRDLSGTKRGTTYCEDFDTYCDQYYATIDYNYIVQSSTADAENVKKTICHELGHTVGLTHGADPGYCMISGEVGTDIKWRRYAPHHKNDHIDPWFQ